MVKLFLHPGHSKCGSTSIQQALVMNRQLLQQYNLIVPDSEMRLPGEPGFNQHTETPRPVFQRAMNENNTQALETILERIIPQLASENQSLIISAENLVNRLNTDAGRKIHHVLKRFFSSIQVIYYIKRQDRFILSAWQQWGYKTGQSLNAYLKETLKKHSPNYLMIAQTYCKIYGREHLALIPVHRAYLYKNDLILDFFKRLGVDTQHVAMPPNKSSNRSMSPALCDIFAKLPHHFENIHDETIKRKLETLLENHPLLYTPPQPALTKAQVRKVYQRYEKDNQQLQATYFPDLALDEFFSIDENENMYKQKSMKARIDETNYLLTLQMDILLSLLRKLS